MSGKMVSQYNRDLFNELGVDEYAQRICDYIRVKAEIACSVYLSGMAKTNEDVIRMSSQIIGYVLPDCEFSRVYVEYLFFENGEFWRSGTSINSLERTMLKRGDLAAYRTFSYVSGMACNYSEWVMSSNFLGQIDAMDCKKSILRRG